MDRYVLTGSELAKLAFLLRLAAMTGREIAAARPTDKDEIFELVDRAEEVGKRLDEIAKRQDARQASSTMSVQPAEGAPSSEGSRST